MFAHRELALAYQLGRYPWNPLLPQSSASVLLASVLASALASVLLVVFGPIECYSMTHSINYSWSPSTKHCPMGSCY